MEKEKITTRIDKAIMLIIRREAERKNLPLQDAVNSTLLAGISVKKKNLKHMFKEIVSMRNSLPDISKDTLEDAVNASRQQLD